MEIPRKKKRLFGGCILLLMTALALFTTVLAADGQWEAEGSYSLVIQKQFATVDSKGNPIPDEVLEEAKKETYRFRIEGYYLKRQNDGSLAEVPIQDTVTIGPNSPDWSADTDEEGVRRWRKSETLFAPGPIHVSVTEITNDVTVSFQNS